MQLLEQQCPHCNALLRLRGPVREAQQFTCPDCSRPLKARINGGLTSLVQTELNPFQSPVRQTNQPASSRSVSPALIAWGVAGTLMLAMLWILLGSEGSAPPLVTVAGTGVKEEIPDAPGGEPPEELKPAAIEPAPPAEVTKDPSPPNVVPVSKPTTNTTIGTGIDAPPPADEPVADSIPAPEEPMGPGIADANDISPTIDTPTAADQSPTRSAEMIARQREEQNAAAVTAIQQRLQTEIVSYEMEQPVRLRDFLDELSKLSATWINTNELGEKLDSTVQVSLKKTTVEAILLDGLRQAGLQFEVLPNGIHFLP